MIEKTKGFNIDTNVNFLSNIGNDLKKRRTSGRVTYASQTSMQTMNLHIKQGSDFANRKYVRIWTFTNVRKRPSECEEKFRRYNHRLQF